MHRVLIQLFGASAACAALALPATADGALVGPQDLSTFDGSFGCITGPECTYSNLKLPSAGGLARSPISGTITKWRVMVQDGVGTGSGPLSLQVLRRTKDKPGWAGDEFQVIRQTTPMSSAFGRNVFLSALRIRKGDFVGVVDSNGTSVESNDASGAVIGLWDPARTKADPAAVADFLTPGSYLLFNATVKG